MKRFLTQAAFEIPTSYLICGLLVQFYPAEAATIANTELVPGLHGRVRGWCDNDDLFEGGFARRGQGQPLPIIVELWNAHGHDQPIPAADKVLRLRVSFSPEKISRQGYLVSGGVWSPVAARTSVAWRDPPGMLPPGQIVRLAPIDVRQWIDLKDTGFYQVSLGSSSLHFSQGPRWPYGSFGDKLGTGLPIHSQPAYNPNVGLKRFSSRKILGLQRIIDVRATITQCRKTG